ncbi:MAG TPA: DUF2339 domain-containing protein [Pseudacidobacterium sp.]|jgi:uncharacterized membrane protein|nr:DUF2339 domain-containing protein [Pseudacidobacterium sp.]
MSNDVDELRRQVAELTERVRRLEQAQANAIPRVEQEGSIPVIVADAAEPQRRGSLERRIGSQVFNRVGILAVLIGMAWFLKFAIDNHWIGPLGRILVGLITGVALVAWSERFRSKGYPAFSYSLKAIGSGILYLSLWAAFELYQLIPSEVAFVGMVLVTAWNAFMCWVQDAEILALYAIVGGFATPLLLSTGENHQLALFSYLLLLDIAVLTLIALRPWSRLLLAAFAGTVFFIVAWYIRFYSDPQFALTAFFFTAFFLLFAIAPKMLRGLQIADAAHLSTQDNIVLVLLPLANAALGFLGFYFLLDTPDRKWAQPWTAILFAAFYLLLLQVPARRGTGAKPVILSSLHLAIAVIFLTIAIPLEAHGRWITIGWLAEGAILMWLASRLRLLLLRVLAICALLLGFIALIVLNPVTSTTVLFNARFATYLIGIAAFACSAWIAANTTGETGEKFSWRYIAGGSVIAVNALIMIAVCLEIHSFWWNQAAAGQTWSGFSEHKMYAQFTYSAWMMLFGAVLLAVGFWKKSAFLRWQALILIAGSIGKVFIVDTGQLSQGYRILSFLGLGALLLTVSFAYQRDWLNLRNQEKSE